MTTEASSTQMAKRATKNQGQNDPNTDAPPALVVANTETGSFELEEHKHALDDQLDEALPVKRRRLNHSDYYRDELEKAMLKKLENELELIQIEVVSSIRDCACLDSVFSFLNKQNELWLGLGLQ